jgi:hypothetical protein
MTISQTSLPIWFGKNAIAGTVTNVASSIADITTKLGDAAKTSHCLVIFWDDIKSSLEGAVTAFPNDDGDKWLSAIAFNSLSQSIANPNRSFPTRSISVTRGNMMFDNSSLMAGQPIAIRTVTFNIYSYSGLTLNPHIDDFIK